MHALRLGGKPWLPAGQAPENANFSTAHSADSPMQAEMHLALPGNKALQRACGREKVNVAVCSSPGMLRMQHSVGFGMPLT